MTLRHILRRRTAGLIFQILIFNPQKDPWLLCRLCRSSPILVQVVSNYSLLVTYVIYFLSVGISSLITACQSCRCPYPLSLVPSYYKSIVHCIRFLHATTRAKFTMKTAYLCYYICLHLPRIIFVTYSSTLLSLYVYILPLFATTIARNIISKYV